MFEITPSNSADQRVTRTTYEHGHQRKVMKSSQYEEVLTYGLGFKSLLYGREGMCTLSYCSVAAYVQDLLYVHSPNTDPAIFPTPLIAIAQETTP